MTTKLKIPKIRFKEFSGEWEETGFSSVYDFVGSNSYSRDCLNYEDGEIKNIHYGDIHTKFKSNFKIKNEKVPFINIDIDLSKITDEKYCKEGDLVIADASEDYKDIGKTIELIDLDNQKVVAGLHTFIARPKKNKVALGFGGYFMKTFNIRLQVMTLATGIKVLGISKTNLGLVNINIPSLPEQQKIASFLSSVDEKIEKIKEKKKNLEEYKKGVMQKIFSQEIRFKDENGEEFGEWEKKKLGELCDILVGGTPSTINPLFWDGEINWLSSGELNNGYITETSKKITELGLKKSATKLMPINTILLAMTGATLGRIGFLKIESSGNQSIAGFIPNGNYNSKFLFYTLENGFNYILSFAAGAAQPGVNKTTIENFIFIFPTLKEQEKIADFLSGIDKKIEKVGEELVEMEEFKKGLLQGMFV